MLPLAFGFAFGFGFGFGCSPSPEGRGARLRGVWEKACFLHVLGLRIHPLLLSRLPAAALEAAQIYLMNQ